MGNALRHAIVPRIHFIPGLRSKITTSTTPAMRRSALVVKTRHPRQLAGTLCPNPVLPTGERLDSVLGNAFALISTQPLTTQQCERLHQRGAIAVTATPDSELGRWLCRGGARAAVIRPDRTVMQAGQRLETLCHAVPRFLLSDRTGQHDITAPAPVPKSEKYRNG